MDELERAGVPQRCPRCSRPRRGEGLHHHSESVWCVGCGWSKSLGSDYRDSNLSFMQRFIDEIKRGAR